MIPTPTVLGSLYCCPLMRTRGDSMSLDVMGGREVIRETHRRQLVERGALRLRIDMRVYGLPYQM